MGQADGRDVVLTRMDTETIADRGRLYELCAAIKVLIAFPRHRASGMGQVLRAPPSCNCGPPPACPLCITLCAAHPSLVAEINWCGVSWGADGKWGGGSCSLQWCRLGGSFAMRGVAVYGGGGGRIQCLHEVVRVHVRECVGRTKPTSAMIRRSRPRRTTSSSCGPRCSSSTRAAGGAWRPVCAGSAATAQP